jgi:hypothetical protein
MNKVIGLNIPQSKRSDYWEAMRVFRAGSIELKRDPDTKHIAIEDEGRYNRLLNLYVKEPILAEESCTRH